MCLGRQFLKFTAASLLTPTAIFVLGANSSVDGPFKPLVKVLLDVQKPVPTAVAKYLEAKRFNYYSYHLHLRSAQSEH